MKPGKTFLFVYFAILIVIDTFLLINGREMLALVISIIMVLPAGAIGRICGTIDSFSEDD